MSYASALRSREVPIRLKATRLAINLSYSLPKKRRIRQLPGNTKESVKDYVRQALHVTGDVDIDAEFYSPGQRPVTGEQFTEDISFIGITFYGSFDLSELVSRVDVLEGEVRDLKGEVRDLRSVTILRSLLEYCRKLYWDQFQNAFALARPELIRTEEVYDEVADKMISISQPKSWTPFVKLVQDSLDPQIPALKLLYGGKESVSYELSSTIHSLDEQEAAMAVKHLSNNFHYKQIYEIVFGHTVDEVV